MRIRWRIRQFTPAISTAIPAPNPHPAQSAPMRCSVRQLTLFLCVSASLCALLGAHDGRDGRVELFGDRADSDTATFEFEVDLDAASKLKMSQRGASVRDVPSDVDEVIDLDAEVERRQPSEKEDDDNGIRPGRGVMHVTPRGFNYGRGVAYSTLSAVRAGSPLFSLDLAHVMSLSSAARGRIQMLLEVNLDLPPAIALALHLLEERFLDARSNFSALIDQLPPASNSTVYFGTHELETLHGSQLLRHTLVRQQALDSYYDALLGPATTNALDPPLFSKDEFSRENFRWAMGVVWSHSFQIGLRESDLVLAPILDTIGLCLDEQEYACPANNVVIDEDNHQLVVYATTGYDAGQEVRMSAGDKSSLLLMLNHGISRHRPARTLDKMDVSIFLDSSDRLLDVKQFLHQSMFNASINDTYALEYGVRELRTDMTVSLKLKLLTGAEMTRHMDLITPPTEDSGGKRIVSLRNEFAFTRAVVTTCRNLLAQYPTTLEEDEQKLAGLGESATQTRAGHVLRALVVEKMTLQHTIDLAMREWSDLVLSTHPNLIDAAQS
jgi:hypothetical protein